MHGSLAETQERAGGKDREKKTRVASGVGKYGAVLWKPGLCHLTSHRSVPHTAAARAS